MKIVLPALSVIWATFILLGLIGVDRHKIMGEEFFIFLIFYSPLFILAFIHSFLHQHPLNKIAVYGIVFTTAFAAMWLIIQIKFEYSLSENIAGLAAGLLILLLLAIMTVGLPSWIMSRMRKSRIQA